MNHAKISRAIYGNERDEKRPGHGRNWVSLRWDTCRGWEVIVRQVYPSGVCVGDERYNQPPIPRNWVVVNIKSRPRFPCSPLFWEHFGGWSHQVRSSVLIGKPT